jgi:hypothetical protein
MVAGPVKVKLLAPEVVIFPAVALLMVAPPEMVGLVPAVPIVTALAPQARVPFEISIKPPDAMLKGPAAVLVFPSLIRMVPYLTPEAGLALVRVP